MARTDICTAEEIREMVYRFYDRVRTDPVLGPVFDARIADWDPHLENMVRFWSSILLGTGTYQGMPMPMHAQLPDLSADMFEHWLALFRETTATLGNEALDERANELAGRIARSLWMGYQMTNSPQSPIVDLRHG